MSMDRPVVIWKFGASLDGRIAAADGSSRWITSAEARADAHGLRSASDAVMVGSGTQRIDDPHLAVRDAAADRSHSAWWSTLTLELRRPPACLTTPRRR
jgi:diaminohydroxyphosphoribosylaminopyrimidine deaminase/5-amino-6-(5-phosphoribosylamino)uracil reductase